MMRALELCAGAGGQALGLEKAGFDNDTLVEIDHDACETLKTNRPNWNVLEADIKQIESMSFSNVDLVCGGVPCQPFSKAGKQHGRHDERDLFPTALRIVAKNKPLAFFFENVRGFTMKEFDRYRTSLINQFVDLGYHVEWRLIECADFGVPQLRPRFIMIGKRNGVVPFPWFRNLSKRVTVAESISHLLGAKGWKNLEEWRTKANRIAPTIVGGSKKHGGPDLGPTRAKREWAKLGIDGHGIADEPPDRDFNGQPRLTNRMVATLQGFPENWDFCGAKTSIYRQIGNAFPYPVAQEFGKVLFEWIQLESDTKPSHHPIQASYDVSDEWKEFWQEVCSEYVV